MAWHVYGVMSDSDPLEGTIGLGEQPLQPIDGNGLRVVCSEVDDDQLPRRADLLAHAHALESLAEHATVIPMQYGVVMPDDETVRAELTEQRRDELERLIEVFEGLVQLSVVVDLVEEEALREVLTRRQDLADARREVERAPAAERQAQQVRLGEAVAQELELLREDVGDNVVQRLAPFARAVATNEVQGALQAANVALLVERDRQVGLDEAVTQLRKDCEGIAQVRYVGPQPPYAFLDSVAAGDVPWA